jgi:hypothetical protein
MFVDMQAAPLPDKGSRARQSDGGDLCGPDHTLRGRSPSEGTFSRNLFLPLPTTHAWLFHAKSCLIAAIG